MSVRLRGVAVLGLAVALALGIATEPAAQGATRQCGDHCVTLASQEFGAGQVIAQAATGAVLRAAGSGPLEDFVGRAVGTVAQLARSGKVPAALARTYGAEQVYQLEFEPEGLPGGTCLAASAPGPLAPGSSVPAAGAKVTVRGCGSSSAPASSTLWIGVHGDGIGDFEPFVNVAASSHAALALTAIWPGRPLTVTALTMGGGTAAPAQMWESLIGVYGQVRPRPEPDGSGTPRPGTFTATLTGTLKDPHAGTMANGVSAVALGPGGILAAGDDDGSVYLWDAHKRLVGTLADPHSDGVQSVAFGPGGMLAVGDQSGHVYLWDTATRKLAATLSGAQGIPWAMAFGPGGLLAVGEGDSEGDSAVRLWNTAKRKLTAVIPDPYGFPVYAVALGPHHLVAEGDSSGGVYLWDLANDKPAVTLVDVGDVTVDALVFGPGNVLAAGDESRRTRLWHVATGKLAATLIDPGGGSANAVAFGPAGLLATGDVNGSTYLWDTATSKITGILTDPGGRAVTSVLFVNRATVATGDINGSSYLWRVTKSEP